MHPVRPHVAARGIELDAGESRHEFHMAKTAGARLILAMLEQQRTDAAARLARIDEEGADLRGLGVRIESRGIAAGSAVAAEQSRPVAPSSAPHQPAVVL